MFTNRFGSGPGEVLFDRICRENGIKHLLTAPRSPTTTGKVERSHKTLRGDFLTGKIFTDLAAAQAAIDGWVEEYNHDRLHQGIGDVPPFERFRLAQPWTAPTALSADGGPVTTRKVGANGKISFAGKVCPAARWLAGETVDVTVQDGILSIVHRELLVATHVQQHRPDREAAALARPPRRATPTAAGKSKSPTSATWSRSPPAAKSSAPTPSATTAPARTAPSPTPAAEPAEPTPPNPHDPGTQPPEPLRNTGTGT